jgi:hypothetical protein
MPWSVSGNATGAYAGYSRFVGIQSVTAVTALGPPPTKHFALSKEHRMKELRFEGILRVSILEQCVLILLCDNAEEFVAKIPIRLIDWRPIAEGGTNVGLERSSSTTE